MGVNTVFFLSNIDQSLKNGFALKKELFLELERPLKTGIVMNFAYSLKTYL